MSSTDVYNQLPLVQCNTVLVRQVGNKRYRCRIVATSPYELWTDITANTGLY